MKPSRKQKSEIRRYYSYMKLRFHKDGSVSASKGGAFGLLYTPSQLKAHIESLDRYTKKFGY